MLIVHRSLYALFSTRRAVCAQVALVWLIAFLTVLPGFLGHGAKVGFTDKVRPIVAAFMMHFTSRQ